MEAVSKLCTTNVKQCAELFQHNNSSVPARLGKGQGAKEIGHNLARKRPKFEHNLERERPSRAHFYARTPKVRAQSSTRMKQDLGTILWAIDENTGTNLLQAFLYSSSENTKTLITGIGKKKN